ncbi:MAG TPA: acetyl-CoA hydrolase/transferase C-terminal domain-containing protein [Acidobacteriota bacterium]
MDWHSEYRRKRTTAAQAVGLIQSRQRVYLHAGCAVPPTLLRALVARAPELEGVELLQLLTMGEAEYIRPELSGSFRCNNLFIGGNVREAVNTGRADFIPIHLSQIPRTYHSTLPIDAVLLNLSPPDEHGFCSYGIDVGCSKPAAEAAHTVIAQINSKMPRTLGNSFIHVRKLSALVEVDDEVLELPRLRMTDEHREIGRHVASLIEDGSTLQMGIGGIPDAVLSFLQQKNDLGIHTEMFSDGVVELIESGVINNEAKTLHPGKSVASFMLGSRRLYDFVDNNPIIELHPSDYVNDPFVIAQNDRMVAINSAIQVDLTGQVCSDSIGTTFYSGFGGQVDFIRGAGRSKGGKPIIALPSTAKGDSKSRIVPCLDPGSGVVTTRADVRYVVTEYGVAQLWGRPLRERAEALIEIAHPNFRDPLRDAAKERHLL